MSFKILKTMILIWDLFQRNFVFLTQVTYYLRIPDGLWLKTDQHYWKKMEDQRHFQEPMVPSDHHIPGGSLCMYFCRGWWMPCRKLPSELELSFRSQPLKVVFRKNILASVICPWQNETWYFPRLCKSWMLSAPNGLCIDQRNKPFFWGRIIKHKVKFHLNWSYVDKHTWHVPFLSPETQGRETRKQKVYKEGYIRGL